MAEGFAHAPDFQPLSSILYRVPAPAKQTTAIILLLTLLAGVCHELSAKPRRSVTGDHLPVTLFSGSDVLGPIFVPRKAGDDDSEVKAARELAHYLERISGHEWEVKRESRVGTEPGIYVGHTLRYWIDSGQSLASSRDGLARLPRRPDAYFLRVGQERVVISGNTGEATGRAVAHFLGDYAGVRWFIPGPLGESVPRKMRMELTSRAGWFNPAYDSRWMRVADTDWNRRNRLDNWIPSNHNLYRLVKRADYARHPAWKPQVRGERIVGHLGHSYETQPDIAGPGISEHVAREVVRAFAGSLGKPSVSIGMNDSFIFSTSEASRVDFPGDAYYRDLPNASELVFRFSNAVAEDAFTTYRLPGGARYVSQLAYLMHLAPPSFPVNPQVAVYIATDRGQWYDEARRASGIELIEDWSESGAERFGLRDYYYGQRYFIPRVFPSLIAESLRLGEACDATLFMAETDAAWGFDGPKLWLAAQLAADIDADEERLLDEFYTRFYGPAAEPMLSFFALCENQWLSQPGPATWLKYFNNPAQASIFPPAVCDELDDYLMQAEQALGEADFAEPFRERVALTRRAFIKTQLASDCYHAWLPLASNPLADEAERERFTADEQFFHQAYDKFYAYMKAQTKEPTLAERLLLAMKPGVRLEALDWRGIPLATETFSSLGRVKLPDLDPLTNETVIHWSFPSGWSIRAVRTETLAIGAHVASGDLALKVEGGRRFSFFNWFPVEPGQLLGVRVMAKGRISPGGIARVIVRWADADGKLLDDLAISVLPEGEHQSWIPLAVCPRVPEQARRAYVSLKVDKQFAGDWVAFDNLIILENPRTPREIDATKTL